MANATIKIDLNNLSEIGQRGVRRAAAFVAMGQKAWSDENINSVGLNTLLQIRILPDPLPPDLAAEVRASFRLWIVGNALSEIVQALSLMADDYYCIASYCPHHGKPLPQEVIDGQRRVKSDTNLHGKLLRVETDTGVRAPLLEHTGGWAKARNVLQHNHGIVRHSDLLPGTNELIVSWNEIAFSIDGNDIELDKLIGHRIEAGGLLAVKPVRAERRFKPGEQINFTEQEIMNICMSAYSYIGASIKELQTHVSRYVPVTKAGGEDVNVAKD
jgi:nitrite reductase/ring-hydroxylating ferredoxin subunit